MSCSGCSDPNAPYFSEAGDPFCRRCFNAQSTRAQETRAVESEMGLEVTGETASLGGRLRGMGVTLIVLSLPVIGVSALGPSGRGILFGVGMLVAGISMFVTASRRGP